MGKRTGRRPGRAKRKGLSNVWRSYSDMMSGLLLLFVLIMAVFLMQAQKNYTDKLAEQAKLIRSQSELDDAQTRLQEQQALLTQQESEIELHKTELGEKESELADQKMTLAEQAKLLEELQKTLEDKELDLTQKESEVGETQELLKQKESELNESQNALDEANRVLASRQTDLQNSQAALDTAQELLREQQGKIDRIIGVKAELVEQLQKEFLDQDVNVHVDTDTGAILLDSGVLYEFGKSELTEEGKDILAQILPIYCYVLVSGEHADDIAEIIIEGYTDSVGGYMENMELSWRRANSVAQFLLDEVAVFFSEEETEALREKLSVNGKGPGRLIMDDDGNENADASRRVEIKFRLKDEEMILELQKLLSGEDAAGTPAVPAPETEPAPESAPETETEQPPDTVR